MSGGGDPQRRRQTDREQSGRAAMGQMARRAELVAAAGRIDGASDFWGDVGVRAAAVAAAADMEDGQ